MKKLALLLPVLLLLALLVAAHAEAPTPEFEFDASKAIITAYNGPGGDVVIPAEIDGQRVWDVKNIFYECPVPVTSITLPEGFDVLNDNLISQIPDLARLTLPESLRVICRGNLQNCPALTEVTIPAGVCYIADNSFSWCEQLTSITFTGRCPLICDFTFSVLGDGCVVHVPDDEYDAYRAAIPSSIDVQPSGQNAVVVNDSTPEDQFAFDPATGTITGYRDRLARMDIPSEIGGVPVKAIGAEAFYPAYHLMYLTVPDGVEVIGDSAFAHTNSILYIGLPDSVRKVGDEAFLGAIRGNRFHWPASLETIGNRAFENCYFTDDIVLSPSVKSIGDGAFAWSWPSNLRLAEGCQPWIGSKAFEHGRLSYIQMDTYEFFDAAPDAFEGSYVTDVDLPWDSGWESRLAWQDYFSAQLEDCEVFINNPPDCAYTDGDNHLYEKGADGYYYLTQYNDGEEAPYLYYNIRDNSGDEPQLIQCRGLGDGVFKGNQTIRRFRVTHANWPWHIGAEALADSSVELVDLFYTTETIGARAFANCVNLTEITLPASLTSIDATAFEGCVNLARVTVLCDMSVLPENLFADCAALMADPSGLVLPANAPDDVVARLSEEMGCPWYQPLLRVGESPREIIPMPYEPTDPSLFEFRPETGTIVRYWGDEADVVVPREIDGVTVTGMNQSAFDRCFDYTDSGVATNRTDYVTLRSVVLPETITEIKDGTFTYCQQLESFICYAPVKSTGRGTFRLCRNLDTVVFVNGVKEIDNYCFDSAGPLSTFYNPVALDYIGERAFQNCAVKSFAVDATTLGGTPFSNCKNLTELHLTDRVAQHNMAVAYQCPNLALVCFETTDLSPFSKDGIVTGCAEALTVRLPQDADEAAVEQAAKHTTMWGTNAEVTVEQAACDRVPAELPDIDALLASYAANPIATPTPEPVVTPAPAQPVGEAGEPFLGSWTVTEITMGGETHAASEFGMEMGITFNADGTALMRNADGSTGEMTWSVVDGAAILDGVRLTLAEDGTLVADQEGMRMVFVRDGEAAPAPEPEPEPAAQPVGEAGEPFLGSWTVTEITMGGETHSAAELGMDMGVTFNADGTARVRNADGSTGETTWSVSDGAALLDGIPLVPAEDGTLVAEQQGMRMVFAREGGTAPEPEPEPAPEPEPQPEPDGAAAFLDVKLTCVSVESSGYAVNPESLGGEYSVTFHSDGRLTFVLSGSALPDLTWTQDGADRVSDYYGQGELRFEPTASGYTLNFLDVMVLTFEA